MTTIAELGVRVNSQGVDQAAQDLDRLVGSAVSAESAVDSVGETSAQASARISNMVRASLEASDYHQRLAKAATSSSAALEKANASTIDWTKYQEEINARGQAIIQSQQRIAEQAKKSATAVQEQSTSLDAGSRNLTRFNDQLGRTGLTARQTQAAMRGLPAQFTDIFTSLQAGQSPMQVFLQQGGQIKDSFGGVGPAAQAMGGYIAGLISPLTLSAAAVTGLAVAVVAGIGDLNEFNKALALTGGVAGKTSSQLVDLQNKLANGKYFSQANEALLALVGSGKLTGETFDAVAGAATQLSAASGESAGKFAQMFVDAKNDVTAFALEFNSKYHAVTLATFDQIQALEDQGRHMDALKLLAGEVSEEMTRRNEEISESTRGIAKLWDDATSAVRRYWNELKQGVAADPDQFRMQVLQQQVADIDKQFWFSDRSRDALKKQYTDEIALIQKRIDAGAKERLDRAQAEAAVQKQADLQKKLNDQLDQANPERKRAKALQDLKQRFIDLREAAKDTGRQSPLLAGVSFDGDRVSGGAYDTLAKGIADRNKDKVGKTTLVDLSGFNDQKNALAAILSEYKNHQKELDAAQKAGLISQESYAAQRAAIIEQQKAEVTNAYEAEIKALEAARGRTSTSAQQRIQLDQKIADARSAMVKAQKDADTELAILAANEDGRLARQKAATKAYVDQLERQRAALAAAGTRAANSLGLGDRQAGLQSSLDGATDRFNDERAKLLDRRRTAPDKYSQEDYKRDLVILAEAEDKYRDTVISNYDKITKAQGDWHSGASSAFQTYLESARDVAGQTKSLFTSAFSSMEDSIANFATTGKLSFSDFAKSILADMARIATRAAASQALSSLFGGFFGGGNAAAQSGVDNLVSNSGLFANGGAFAGGVQMFATGGAFTNSVVSTPTAFGMSGGRMGVMGEAGPEAVMPLTRTSSGALGVRAVGGGSTVVAPVSVTIQDTGASPQAGDAGMDGATVQRAVASVVEQAISNELRPSGRIWRAIHGR
ncbi:phage tail tape measure protein [Pseudomonas aeruginosa]|uniref:phage tail tape measure protein n=1 Tax=Pseudomonas aeruginosa TaxID=287 RepID=UPI001232E072|nr:phage tail tape measure protein [Pseudomonas aeruginosa]KAA5614831.1 phage tail tape measure protein [Pseudomonas aeruginosa]KAA5635690.1 phage tail tape measure protein [Pseudomonas aeruginosa]KAA5662605.1 phage tail tape measure protein [Pseudomonas aeruginosa]MDI2300985.1 phage tail tape measure protein [Pseudomonas aeruginosa]HBN9555421.1 phage tail tape measure protein [Pseudomonas aeruginosa]